ncbi:MAG: ATP synthase F0 subunit C [Myxococcota bacterium]
MLKLKSFVAFVMVSLSSSLAFADAHEGHSPLGMMYLALAIGIGLAAAGGAYGQGRAASAALEGIARNPNASDKVFVPMILGLAFIESLVLFTWVLMFLMNGSIGTLVEAAH